MTRSIGLGSFAKRLAIGAAFAFAAGACADRASAGGGGPLTGIYTGKASCSGLQNGVPIKRKQEFGVKSPVLVTHGDTRAVLNLPGVGVFVAFVENNAQKPGQSPASGITCTLDPTLEGATIFLRTKVKGDNATLKGTFVILADGVDQSESCKISVKRIDANNPNAACPK